MRFIASDFGAPSVVEAAVDDLRVTAISCTSAAGAGRVPDGLRVPGQPLLPGAEAGGDLTLDWGGLCLLSDTDYGAYEGALGDFDSHLPRLCTTGGQTAVTISPAQGSSYYLVVPTNDTVEGSYGTDSQGNERPVGTIQCHSQLADSCP